MRVALKKHKAGATTLHCERADGTVTWQQNRSDRGVFFALHDLTHLAVETTLAIDDAFYGLIASGWDIEDTTGKGARGPIPDRAMHVEHLVGLLDQERAGLVVWEAAVLNEQAERFFADSGRVMPEPLTDEQLDAIRERMRDLFGRWNRTGPDEVLELRFEL